MNIQPEALATKLLELSKEDGLVTSAGVEKVLYGLRETKLRDPKAVLTAYLDTVKKAVREQTITVEYAGALSPEALKQISEKYEAQYDRKLEVVTEENEELIAGIRVSVADDVYDASVAGRLQALATQVQ
ncbi:MAG: F0F1 ATP synthase subunit delta [Opitutales bacterium]